MKQPAWIWVSVALLAGCAATAPATRPQAADAPTVVASPTTGLAPGIQPVSRMRQAAELIAALPRDSKTLVVFDIDDTLLTTPRRKHGGHVFFGSDRWYLWQDAKPNLSPDKASGDEVVPCLFDVIAMNYELGLQEATEADAPAIIAAVPFDRMVLTSRSADYREATERQLATAGYPMPVFTTLGTAAGGFGFRSTINDAFVSYANGIFMTRGGNKGKMLLELLSRPELALAYDHVVLVDDSQDKLENMRDALAGTRTVFHGLRYEGVKPHPLAPVTPADKQDSATAWDAWAQFLQRQYPERWARIAGRDGACKAKAAQP